MADATATYSAEQVERLLICAVCLDRFNNPKILPCQHTFCKSPCLEGLIDRRVGMIKCPECRSQHFVPREGADAFPTNITVSGFLDLPTRRSDTPMDVGVSPQHNTTQSSGHCAVCETEAETVKCFHCDQMVCDSCKQLHLGQMKIDIGRLLNQVRRGIPQLSNTISSVEQRSEEFKSRVETVKSEVGNSIERYTKELRDREKMLHSELETYLQGELRLLRLHQENVEVELASISSYCDSTETLLNDNSNIPERDLVSVKKQCSDYLGQIQETSNNPIPELRDVSFRNNDDHLHSSIMSLGELNITTPSTVNANTNTPNNPRNNTQPTPGRSRWSDVEPVDMAALENFRVSPSFSYAPTQRTGRRSHSPPQTRQTNRTQYTRPSRSSMELGDAHRFGHGYHPSQTLPTVRNMPSRTNDYLFRMDSPTSEDLLDIMDRNRREEMNRRLRGGSRLRTSQTTPQRQRERVAGLMGGGGGGSAAGYSPAQDNSMGNGYNVIPHISSTAVSDGIAITPGRGTSETRMQSPEISRAAAEAAERRARNTALTRTTDNRPAAAFIIPLSGGPPQDISRSEPSPTAQPATVQSNSPTSSSTSQPPGTQSPPMEVVQTDSSTHDTITEEPAIQQTEPVPPEEQSLSSQENQGSSQEAEAQDMPTSSTQQTSPQSVPQETVTQPQTTAATQNTERPQNARQMTNAPARSQGRPSNRRRRSERSNSTNDSSTSRAPRRRGNSTSTTDSAQNPQRRSDPPTNTSQTARRRGSSTDQGTSENQQQASLPDANTGSATERPSPPSRARTFVQEDGPSTSSANIPTVSGTSSTFDVPITETLGDLDTSELDNIHVDESVNVVRSLIDYQSKGTLKKQIGGERGNRQGYFTWPRGVAVSPINDGIVVADSSNHRVQIFDLDGRFVAMFGSYGQAGGEFDCLAGVAVNRLGQIVIADRYNHRIQIFDRYGEFCHSFGEEGDGNGQMNYPWGVTADRGGFVYVCDKENHRIQVFQANGTFVRKFGGLGDRVGKLENPHYITVGFDGNVYVSDCYNHRVQVFSDTGRFIRTIGIGEGSDDGQLKYPKGIAVDRQGFVIVADSGNNRVQVFRGDGRFYSKFGSWGTGPGQFKGMEGIALASNGNIVVSDKENHRIQIF